LKSLLTYELLYEDIYKQQFKFVNFLKTINSMNFFILYQLQGGSSYIKSMTLLAVPTIDHLGDMKYFKIQIKSSFTKLACGSFQNHYNILRYNRY
jgi:hypothetical protein